MRRLEKIDGKLFESLKSSVIVNLNTIKGAEIQQTQGTTKVACGKSWITKNFTDKQNYHLDPKKGVVYDGEPYGFQLEMFINNEIDFVNAAADAIIYDEI